MSTPQQAVRRARDSRSLLWLVFFLAHAVPLLAGLFILQRSGFGDPRHYQAWVEQGLRGHGWPVINVSWVYPVGALLPMILLAPLKGVEAYLVGWVLLSLTLNAIVLLMLQARGRTGRTASWWWVLSIALLGPVAISRLESVMVPLAVIATLLLAKRPAAASALLTLAGWIKVVPMVWLIPVVLSDRKNAGRMIASSGLVSAALVVPALLLGSGSRIFSFLTDQADRGLQIESVPASLLQAGRLWGLNIRPVFSDAIITWQFDGGVAMAIGRIATLFAVPALLVALLLTRRALRLVPERRLEVVAAGILAATLTLIVFNKVGSPQYLDWLSVAMVFGLLNRRAGDRVWTRWAVSVLVMDAMTQVIYPHFYPELVAGHPVMVLMLLARNLMLIALLVGVVRWLASLRVSGSRGHREILDGQDQGSQIAVLGGVIERRA